MPTAQRDDLLRREAWLFVGESSLTARIEGRCANDAPPYEAEQNHHNHMLVDMDIELAPGRLHASKNEIPIRTDEYQDRG